MTNEELRAALEKARAECTKDAGNQPDIILARPFEPWRGDWKRFICRWRGHAWEKLEFVNIQQICKRCCAVNVKQTKSCIR